MEMLRRAVRQQPQLRYSGERMVELVVDGDRRVLTEFVLRDGPRARITYPEDSPRRGFVVVETDEGRWEFNPTKNEIRRSRPQRGEAIHLLGGLVRAVEEGRFRAMPLEPDNVAGRRASGVAISDAKGNVARRLWIDAETGLILKAEQFGRVGERLASFAFRRVNFDPVIRPGDFGPIRREGAKIVNDEQDFDVPWTVRVPSWLPPGFEESGRGLRSVGTRPVLLIHYSDGTRHFSLLQAAGRTAPEPDTDRPARGVNLRQIRLGDVWFVVVGNLEPETLDRVVQSIGRE
jgi:hypothetical protein